jgi:uncharacterized protein (DUF1778 family)
LAVVGRRTNGPLGPQGAEKAGASAARTSTARSYPPKCQARSEKLDLRLTAEAKRTLRAAAAAAKRSVSDLVLESALTRAAETLTDRQHFGLNAEQWAAFQAALDAPVRDLRARGPLAKDPPALSDQRGHFTFSNLVSGQYNVQVLTG